MRRTLAALTVLAGAAATLSGCAAADADPTVVTVRLWDEAVARAYEESFAEFSRRRPDVAVDVAVVPWEDYWTSLRIDVAAGTADDIFWINSAQSADLIDSGALQPIDEDLVAEAGAGWDASVVRQYSADGRLWGVPQLVDLGIGVFYNEAALASQGLDRGAVSELSWDPGAPNDPLRSVATRLTVDDDGRHPDEAGFDADRVARYGYSASNDLNAMILSTLGSAGATWQTGSEFTFASPEGMEAIGYLVDLINEDHVAPPASDTNPPAGNDAALELFLRGRLALFQSGSYHLAPIEEGATFPWGIAPLPAGPEGAVTPTNGIAAAASSTSEHPDAVEAVLRWMSSERGMEPVADSGAAFPAVIAAQGSYVEHWRASGVDITPMVDVLSHTIGPPTGAGYAAAQSAYQPILNRVFTAAVPLTTGLQAAQDAANDAMSATR